MTRQAERHHWLNTVVGVLDSVFYLTEEETFAILEIVGSLLKNLNIPDRGIPAALPAPVAQEVAASYYSRQLANQLDSGSPRHIRPATEYDVIVGNDTWREALAALFTTAYPDITGEERLLLSKVLEDLLAAIGAPDRAPAFLPDLIIPTVKDMEGQ